MTPAFLQEIWFRNVWIKLENDLLKTHQDFRRFLKKTQIAIVVNPMLAANNTKLTRKLTKEIELDSEIIINNWMKIKIRDKNRVLGNCRGEINSEFVHQTQFTEHITIIITIKNRQEISFGEFRTIFFNF